MINFSTILADLKRGACDPPDSSFVNGDPFMSLKDNKKNMEEDLDNTFLDLENIEGTTMH